MAAHRFLIRGLIIVLFGGLATDASAQFFGRFPGPFGVGAGPLGVGPLGIGPVGIGPVGIGPVGIGPFAGPLVPPPPLALRLPAVPVAPGVIATPYGPAVVAPLPPRRFGRWSGLVVAEVSPLSPVPPVLAVPPVAPLPPAPAFGDAIGSVQQALIDLTTALESREDGSTWLDYLRPNVVALAIETWSVSQSPDSVEQLRLASQPFEGIAANPQLAWIRDLPGFEEVRLSLREIVGETEADVSQGRPMPGPTLAPQPAQEDRPMIEEPRSGNSGGGSVLQPENAPPASPKEKSVNPAATKRQAAPEVLPAPVPTGRQSI